MVGKPWRMMNQQKKFTSTFTFRNRNPGRMTVFEWDNSFQKITAFSKGKTRLVTKNVKGQFWTEIFKKEKFVAVKVGENPAGC